MIDRRRGRGAERRALHVAASPTTHRDEAFQKEYAAVGQVDATRGTAFKAAWLDLDEADYQARLRARDD